MKKSILCTVVFSLFAAIVQAQNENVTWQAPQNITGASDVSTLGTYFGSWAPYDGNANNLPVNGVKFEGNPDLPGMNVNFPSGDQSGYNGFHNPGTPNGNYNDLLQTATYCGSGNGTIVVTWSDVPGHTYLIQLWGNDGRGLFPGRSETVTGGANTSAGLDIGDAPGQYVIGTYVADSSGSETITVAGSASGDSPTVNLLLIRDITGTNSTITWQTPVNISGASDVNTQGTYFGSWAPNDGSANTLPVNGVTFQGNSDLPGLNVIFPDNDQNGYNGFHNPGTANANYNSLLQSATYCGNGNGTIEIKWSNIPGHTYLVQVWANDGRGIFPGRSETVTGGNGVTDTSASLDDGDAPGQYIIGTYVAGFGTETITVAGSANGDSPIINLLQVRDLTAAAPVTNYKSTVLADGPLGYWPLDLTDANAANGIATDLSGNGNDGDYYGISASGNLVAGPSPYLANAASFNTAEVDLGSGTNPLLLDFGGPITMEAWVQPASPTVGGSSPADILAKGYDADNNYDELALRATGGNYYGGTYNGSDNGGNAQGGQETTNWAYVVSTYDGANWNMYVNGQLVGQAADTVGAIEWQATWAIGNGTLNGDGRLFQGNLCQVALYNYALTPAQVLTHYYQAELGGSPATAAPIILSQPQAQTGFVNGSITFTVGAVSALATTNQWYKGGVPIAGQTNAALVLNNLQLSSAGNYTVVVGNANGKITSAVAVLTVVTGNNLRWNDGGTSGVWDTDTTANWLNLASSQQTVFNAGDAVLFDDTPGNSTSISLNTSVSPSVVTVNSSVNNYTFGGSSSLTGSGGLVKEGASTLTIVSPGNFTGPVTIGGGVVYAGNSAFQSVSSLRVTNNSTLDFGGSTYNTGQPVSVSGTGVTNEGALYNSFNDDPNEVFNITLIGNTTFGGAQRWDLVAGSTISGPYKLTVNWASGGYGEWNTTTLGTNVGNLELASGSLGIKSMGATFGNPANTFTVDSGCQLDFWTGDPGYAKNFHILSGGKIQLLSGFTSFSGNFTFENGSQFNSFYGSGGNEIVGGTITLNGNTHFVLGDSDFFFTNVISGVGGFVWDAYNHEMILEAANTYSGPTVIGGGLTLALSGNGSIADSTPIFFGGGTPGNVSLDVSGRPDDTLTLASGQTLGGNGTVNGKLVVSAGATIAPGGTNIILNMTEGSSVTGTLEASNNITLGGNTVMKLDGSGVSDEIISATRINYGGTLTVANVSGSPLAVGNSFQLFSAPALSGTFTISPSIPGPGLAWDTSQLTANGSLNVIAGSSPAIKNVQYTSGKLIFSGTGGSANANYVVYANTNLATANWVPVQTNAFDGSGNFSVTNAVNANTPQTFYRIK
jgi:autotransporter-associated beta strand protein